MTGDLADFVSRLRAVLPKRWFADQAPNLTAILNSIATPWTCLYGLFTYAGLQTRIATATDSWLDLIALDFFGQGLPRQAGESDTSYRSRISQALLRGAATRSAISLCMKDLTGSAPGIFEPAKCSDTGAYAAATDGPLVAESGLAYGLAGGWGNLNMPLQFFVTVKRPPTPGVAMLAGYRTGAGGYDRGSIAYADLSLLPGQLTEQDIQTTLSDLLPVNATAWLQII
jgi:hypothetical protein